MADETVSHFTCGDNGHTLRVVIQPDQHFVSAAFLKTGLNLGERALLTPKQARRMAEALRIAARQAEANGRPRQAVAAGDEA